MLLVAAGDGAALSRLVARWTPAVFAFFERTREPSLAAEAALETFERLVAESPRYPPNLPFSAFLWGIAARVLQEAGPGEVLGIARPRLAESAAARTALVRSAIAALPAGERSAFLLVRIARLPVATAAAALGTSVPDVRRRLVRALELLRLSLAPLLEGPPEPTPPEGMAAAAGEPDDGTPPAASP